MNQCGNFILEPLPLSALRHVNGLFGPLRHFRDAATDVCLNGMLPAELGSRERARPANRASLSCVPPTNRHCLPSTNRATANCATAPTGSSRTNVTAPVNDTEHRSKGVRALSRAVTALEIRPCKDFLSAEFRRFRMPDCCCFRHVFTRLQEQTCGPLGKGDALHCAALPR